MYIKVFLLSFQHPKDILQNIHSHITSTGGTDCMATCAKCVDTFNYTYIKHLHNTLKWQVLWSKNEKKIMSEAFFSLVQHKINSLRINLGGKYDKLFCICVHTPMCTLRLHRGTAWWKHAVRWTSHLLHRLFSPPPDVLLYLNLNSGCVPNPWFCFDEAFVDLEILSLYWWQVRSLKFLHKN